MTGLESFASDDESNDRGISKRRVGMGLACALKAVVDVALGRCMRLSLFKTWYVVLVGWHSAMIPEIAGYAEEA